MDLCLEMWNFSSVFLQKPEKIQLPQSPGKVLTIRLQGILGKVVTISSVWNQIIIVRNAGVTSN